MVIKKAVAFFATAFFCLLPLHAKPPKLLAIVVVDQMIPRYLEKLSVSKNNAAIFPHTKLNYVPTQTAPGHATIVTGVPPALHGIVGNEWFDPINHTRVSAVVHKSKGSGPYFLERDTLGDALKKKSPQSVIISLSVKDRAAILMAGKNANAVAWFDWKSRNFKSSSAYQNSEPWLSTANQQLEDSMPTWLKIPDFLRSPACDRLVFDLTNKAIDAFALGRDENTDLLLVSFSATDNIGHRYGPDSAQMDAQIESLDKILSELTEKLASVTGNNFNLILTSDHGVLPIPEEPAGQKIGALRVNKKDFIKKMEHVLSDKFKGGPWIEHCTTLDVYFDRKKIRDRKISPSEFLRTAAEQIRTLPEVAQAYTPPDFLESDEFTEIFQRSYFPERSGDLMIRLKPGVLVTHESNGTSHGSPYAYDATVPLLILGPGIAPFVSTKTTSLEDVFYTAWDILELGPRHEINGQHFGHSLTEIFSKN